MARIKDQHCGRVVRWGAAVVVAFVCGAAAPGAPLAFPGAVGQGAAAVGGRGGDVYRVTTLADYNPKTEEKIEGSLRHAIRSAEGPRTIVFDVAGAIELHAPLEILKNTLTIAGQTSPGGITVWGYPTEISGCRDVIVRYLRFRTGDFNARRPKVTPTSAPVSGSDGHGLKGNNDMDPGSANAVNIGDGAERVILDHVSASWSTDEVLSVTRCRDVTVQNSIIAESLNHSLHPKGDHGYGSLIRGALTPEDQAKGVGGFTLYGNLWAHNKARNPSIGGEQSLWGGRPESDRRRTDVNIVGNVIYDWGDMPTHRSQQGRVRINLVGNYYVIGPAKASGSKYVFRENEPNETQVYQSGNCIDSDRDSDHDGDRIEGALVEKSFVDFGDEDTLQSDAPWNFFGDLDSVGGDGAAAYHRVVKSVGASLWRDAIDRRVIDSLTARSGKLRDSQEEHRGADGVLPGIDDLIEVRRPEGFDTDGDGMPDEFETARDLDPKDARDGRATTLSDSGYTNLEVYLNSLVANEATTGNR